METTRTNEVTGASEPILAVNNDRIDDDPELLRQWVHHRRAELTFGHWGLGLGPAAVLARPGRRSGSPGAARGTGIGGAVARSARARRGAAAGRAARRRLDSSGRPDRPGLRPRHPTTRRSATTKLLHLETFADLALLCLTWKPDGRRAGLVEEVLAFLHDEGPFFDDAMLQQTLKGTQARGVLLPEAPGRLHQRRPRARPVAIEAARRQATRGG